ncbi:hypothetical protein Asi02nite_30950 [Asanoa siamensis]|uniref:Uncharacterized protein n=1 Tax=Asanoa siamensis TaxID=926357 RepID=A0ABQ4CQL8_9ACTN|nr:hypothetical protein Asi02nite_30950 [Asanoa siamensis]
MKIPLGSVASSQIAIGEGHPTKGGTVLPISFDQDSASELIDLDLEIVTLAEPTDSDHDRYASTRPIPGCP